MSNISKRILTSFPLLIIAIFAIYNNAVLVLSLFIISSVLIFEFSNILKKIFKRINSNSLIFINLFVFYVCLFNVQIYFFLSDNIEDKQTIFLFILSICIFTDIGGYIFGKIFFYINHFGLEHGKKKKKNTPDLDLTSSERTNQRIFFYFFFIFSKKKIIIIIIIFSSHYYQLLLLLLVISTLLLLLLPQLLLAVVVLVV